MSSLSGVLQSAWSRWSSKWYGYAHWLTRDPVDARDVVQDAVLRTLQADPDLPNERAAHGYMIAAVRTSALRLFSQRDDSAPPLEEILPATSGPAPTALDVALDREKTEARGRLMECIGEALARLPEEQRQAVELLILREQPLKLREVAEIQGAPVSTVHSRLQSALRKLGNALPDERI